MKSQLTGTAVLNIVGLTPRHLGEHTPRLKAFSQRGAMLPMAEPFPAVTCTSQSDMLTGTTAENHGIVGNGWYFREAAEVGFWKQSNHFVGGEKVYESLKHRHPEFTCAKLFWWYNMYAQVDFAVTPRPHYPADGRKVFDVYTEPQSLHDPLVNELGAFPFHAFWGPAAGIGSSRWIAESAKWTWNRHHPTLNLVYLPHLDYSLQRLGPQAPEISAELKAIDEVAGELIDFYEREGVKVIIVSEYGITQVNRVLHPNRILREAGLLEIRPSLTWEMLDVGASEAFAVSDHQICHIYVKRPERIGMVAKLFEKHAGTRKILVGDERKPYGLKHRRAGDIVLMAEPDCWYTYYYWIDDAKAPDFARCVDIHRKPGYDPVELFFDPQQPLVKLKMAANLAKKKLGFRYLMNVIPLDASLVGGSHGTPVDNPLDGPLCMTTDTHLKSTMLALQGQRPPLTHLKSWIESVVEGLSIENQEAV